MLLSALFASAAGSTASAATLQLLKKLDVPVTAQTVQEAVEGHPDAPSLWSISGALSQWKVENIALQVEPEKLDELPTPFIKLLSGENSCHQHVAEIYFTIGTFSLNF